MFSFGGKFHFFWLILLNNTRLGWFIKKVIFLNKHSTSLKLFRYVFKFLLRPKMKKLHAKLWHIYHNFFRFPLKFPFLTENPAPRHPGPAFARRVEIKYPLWLMIWNPRSTIENNAKKYPLSLHFSLPILVWTEKMNASSNKQKYVEYF